MRQCRGRPSPEGAGVDPSWARSAAHSGLIVTSSWGWHAAPQAAHDDMDRKCTICTVSAGQSKPHTVRFVANHLSLDKGQNITLWKCCPTSSWEEEMTRRNNMKGSSDIKKFWVKGLGFGQTVPRRLCSELFSVPGCVWIQPLRWFNTAKKKKVNTM